MSDIAPKIEGEAPSAVRGVVAIEAVVLAAVSTTAPPPSSTLCHRRSRKSGLTQLEDYPLPFWLALFVEGTRFTPDKLLAAQAFAASRGLPIPKNVLIPCTKVNFMTFHLSYNLFP